jgi:hypothetical protein
MLITSELQRLIQRHSNVPDHECKPKFPIPLFRYRNPVKTVTEVSEAES